MKTNLIHTDRYGFDIPKKAYVAPTLVIYGKLIELTASGSNHSDEEHANPENSNSFKPGPA
jgi:hypothetical protein